MSVTQICPQPSPPGASLGPVKRKYLLLSSRRNAAQRPGEEWGALPASYAGQFQCLRGHQCPPPETSSMWDWPGRLQKAFRNTEEQLRSPSWAVRKRARAIWVLKVSVWDLKSLELLMWIFLPWNLDQLYMLWCINLWFKFPLNTWKRSNAFLFQSTWNYFITCQIILKGIPKGP
jgi:hypothetical protein